MWLTSERHARRIGTGEFTGNCDSCKRPPIKITETHLRYWLLLFGANLQGRTAAVYVREEGLPEELVPIAAELVDFMDALGIAA